MTKAILINLGYGDLDRGFERITVQLWISGYSRPQQFVGSLPAAPNLLELYRNWQSIYTHLCSRLIDAKELRKQPVMLMEKERVFAEEEDDELEISGEGLTNISLTGFDDVCQLFELHLNEWLRSPDFAMIEMQLRSQLDQQSEIQLTLETNDGVLRRLPWHCWRFLQDFPQAELALSQPEYIRQPQQSRDHEKIRILAVLGNTNGIDVQSEQRFLAALNDADITFLTSPTPAELNEQLRDYRGWEILFFAGHSHTEGETGRIYLNENSTDNSLTIAELQADLKIAIANGLKLAIFNSCDGLGLANSLERLYIPTIIIMREQVTNRVAQEFFNYFLQGFAVNHLSLYISVRRAREQLKGLENQFPGASWLPVICQNPAIEPPTWLNITESVRLVLSAEQVYGFKKILIDLIGPIAPNLLQQLLHQVNNCEDLIEKLLPYLSASQQIEFQQQINSLLYQFPETPPENNQDSPNTKNLLDKQNKQIIDPEFTQKCQEILTQIVGPIAPILIQQVTNQGNQSCGEFIAALAAKIPDPQLRTKFLTHYS